jgi:arsenite-transporting ATPase
VPPEILLSNVTALTELTATSLVIVAGKGGVGKTTVTAVLARAAADAGRRVLVLEIDGKPTLEALLPDVEVRHLSAPDLLEEYLLEHGFRRIAKRLAATGVIDVIGTAAPGIDDLVVLGKVKQLERSGEWDLVVVDGPAAGHAITFLTAAPGLLDAARGGPVREQATAVQDMLSDPERCQVVLVTLPETTPVNELIETSYAIEERVGVRLAPIVVNQVDPAADLPDPAAVSFGRARAQIDDVIAAAEFRRERVADQQAELERLTAEVPLRQVRLPTRPTASLGTDDVAALADELTS